MVEWGRFRVAWAFFANVLVAGAVALGPGLACEPDAVVLAAPVDTSGGRLRFALTPCWFSE